MTNYLIIHGTGGSPQSNWFQWLKKKLENKSSENNVYLPAFPTPENQSLKNWFKTFDEVYRDRDEPLVLIGHSIGVAFALRIIERGNIKIKHAVLVAGFTKFLNNKYFDNLNKTFIESYFDWDDIKRNCQSFKLYAGDNDPYVPFEMSREIGDALGVEVEAIKGGGHLNYETGYVKFEKLFEELNV